mmetsp:Transcript_11283/g.24118  ORF Transcript_11283/g.24118 Transcript_11283/m.24118 type:complete len:207 (+) Transcript_11283:263-883(+)
MIPFETSSHLALFSLSLRAHRAPISRRSRSNLAPISPPPRSARAGGHAARCSLVRHARAPGTRRGAGLRVSVQVQGQPPEAADGTHRQRQRGGRARHGGGRRCARRLQEAALWRRLRGRQRSTQRKPPSWAREHDGERGQRTRGWQRDGACGGGSLCHGQRLRKARRQRLAYWSSKWRQATARARALCQQHLVLRLHQAFWQRCRF